MHYWVRSKQVCCLHGGVSKTRLASRHICLFVHSDYKLLTVKHIYRVIYADIPKKKDEDPELYALVSEFMMHGPCGGDNPKCPCMTDNKCSKNFPKPFLDHTSFDSNGYPIYRRRNDGSFVEKSGVKLDNRSVVPYHKVLLKRYQAHINVEWCNQAASIKYLFKYINKDICVHVKPRCGYFGFDVHYRYPSIVRIPFHLPGQQNVVYGADDDIDDVLGKQSVSSSMFLAWMACLSLTEDQLKNLTLYEIEKVLLQNNSSLKDYYGMPYPDHESISSSNNRLITEELDFDRTVLHNELIQLMDSLTVEQRCVFDDIMKHVQQKKEACFLYMAMVVLGKLFFGRHNLQP
ncbi:unnamed protein product [Lactuca virosa]|uniref:Uncharacterized protein n=1 Tax=Lactuca virosa TaxID=75947 RepID=A0AAU9M6J0_9ASTR|nr:unnamed protein product [Lactuca virosa]